MSSWGGISLFPGVVRSLELAFLVSLPHDQAVHGKQQPLFIEHYKLMPVKLAGF
jgi:hypothetical protein